MINKFLGKRLDNGERVEGDIIQKAGRAWIVTDFKTPKCIKCGGLQILSTTYEVHPDSVSMWTGKHDKNGVEVYFGERLKSGAGTEYEVVWVDLMAAFWIIQVSYPYEKYTAEIIPKCEIIKNRRPVCPDKRK